MQTAIYIDSNVEGMLGDEIVVVGTLGTNIDYGDNQRSDSGLKDRTARTELHIANPRIRKTVRDNRGNIIERGTVFVSVTVTAEKFDTTNVNTYEGQSLPSIRGRTAQTDLAIRDGQIMVLGGFREIQMDSTSSKYNLLSDIPYFGEKLFLCYKLRN